MSKKLLLSMTLTLLLCISLFYVIYLRAKQLQDVILPNVYIAKVDVGGLSRKEAEEKLDIWAKASMGNSVRFVFDEKEWLFPLSQFMDIDVKKSIDAALGYCQNQTYINRIIHSLNIRKTSVHMTPVITFKELEYDKKISEVKAFVEVPPKDAIFNVMEDQITIIKDIDGLTIDMGKLKGDLQNTLLDRQTTLKVPVRNIRALKTEQDLLNMSIMEKAMEFSTVFDPTKKDRTENIKLAAETLTGYIIPPEGIFSFNGVVGERTGDKGYKEAPIFYDNQVVPGIGGGICQLSSTIYNLALLSGLEVLERVSHSLPVDYVPLGRDATVNYNSIDLKFKNNTDGFLLLHAEIKGDSLVVKFFGPKRFEDNIKLFSETVKTISSPVFTKKDIYLEKGKTRVKQGASGYQVRLWKINADVGEENRQLISTDTYQPTPTTIYVGEKEIENQEVIIEDDHTED